MTSDHPSCPAGRQRPGCALAPLLLTPDVYAAATTRRDLYSRSRFSALRRKTFRLEGAGRHWRVTLTKVGNLPTSRTTPTRSA